MLNPMTVNYNYHPGDLIRATNDRGHARNARVVDTFPNGVTLQWNDEVRQYLTYATLRERGAAYVAQVVIVRPPLLLGQEAA